MPYLGQVEIFGKNPGATTQTRAEVTTTNQLLTASELVDASGDPLKIDSATGAITTIDYASEAMAWRIR